MKLIWKTVRPLAIVLLAVVPTSLGWAQGMKETMQPEAMREMMQQMMQQMMPMKGMMAAKGPVVPAVTGYSEGWKILFLHTEVSDTEIAKILTEMMGSPVLVVPSLAKATPEMLAQVYVFTNGVTGGGPMGPLGFQPDVFDHPPGSPEYSPLRKIVLVTWGDEASARTLKSAAEVQDALQNGEIAIEEPGVVVNMPMLTWPLGQR